MPKGFSIGKQDVRAAMHQYIKEEAEKQQKGEMKRMMDNLLKESYTDYCPYCSKITQVIGESHGGKAEIVEHGRDRYLVDDCQFCEKPVYVKVVMTPPLSMLDTPSSRGYFFTKDQVYGSTMEIPAEKPKMTGSLFNSR